jgi:hypothetical protein
MRDSNLFGMPTEPAFVAYQSDVPTAPWRGIGLAGLPGTVRQRGPHAHSLYSYDTIFTEQRLDHHSRNPRSRGPYAALYLPPDMYSGPPTDRDSRRALVQGCVVTYVNGRNLYERANAIFIAANTPQQDYLIEFVTPAPQRVWWCTQDRYNRYMEIAASIFFSRLEEMRANAWGPASARAWGPQLDLTWRRDIIHQFHGSHITVRDTAHTITLSSNQVFTLHKNSFLRARTQVMIQSAVMAAEASLLNTKRSDVSVYQRELEVLLHRSRTEPQAPVFLRYLYVSQRMERHNEGALVDPLFNTNA